MPLTRTYAHFTLPEATAALNDRVTFLDARRVSVGSDIFAVDSAIVPMDLRSLFKEYALGSQIAEPVAGGRNAAVVYYGEDAAGKDVGEFLYQCGKALLLSPAEVQLSAFGFYRDRRVPLGTSKAVARSPGGVLELLEDAVPAHYRRAHKARGRAHAVFRFEAAGTLSVFVVDGLPNQLRFPNRDYRLTTRVDDALSATARPALPQRITRVVAHELGEQTPIFVVLHCPLAAKHRFALVDALRFGREISARPTAAGRERWWRSVSAWLWPGPRASPDATEHDEANLSDTDAEDTFVADKYAGIE